MPRIDQFEVEAIFKRWSTVTRHPFTFDMAEKKSNGVVPFYREWDGGELFPIAVDAGTSGLPVGVEDWTEALEQGPPKQPVPDVTIPAQGGRCFYICLFTDGLAQETFFSAAFVLRRCSCR